MTADPDTIGASPPTGPQAIPSPSHIPVLTAEVLDLLSPASGETAADCTAGRGGHSVLFAQRLGPTGTLILNDVDPANLEASAARIAALPNPPRVVAIRGNFVDLPRRMIEQRLAADIVLADLGFASGQMADPARGLSFMRDGPLDMRLDPTSTLTAADLVNRSSEEELTEILRDYGEERQARRVAQKLVEARASGPIETTLRLAGVVRSAFGIRDSRGDGKVGEHTSAGSQFQQRRRPGDRIDPATRTFQALRIAVNDELGCLKSLLESISRAAAGLSLPTPGTPGSTWLRPGARAGIITFHSLEDRLVKQRFAELGERSLAEILTKRPIETSEPEAAANPRSRSAKLRVIRLSARTTR